MIYLGIDPGLDGAVGVIAPTPEMPPYVTVFDTPTFTDVRGKRTYNIGVMNMALTRVMERADGAHNILATVEFVHAMPGQGVTSMFRMGYGLGLWHGLLAANGIAFREVTPQKWKKAFGLDSDKDKSRALAAKMFPLIVPQFARKKDHGRAEAVLLAAYGERVLWA